MKRRQGGVALITIMLIVVVATVLSVQMATEQNLAVNRAAAMFSSYQAAQYAYGGEELARQILHADFEENPQVDNLTEVWASPELKYTFDNGEVELHIEDLGGRLNVNSLRAHPVNGVAIKRFYTLATTLGLDTMYVDRLLDWVDDDLERTRIGAEDYEYLGLDRPYRTPRSAMADISELRLLLDMDDLTFNRLAPYIYPLPDVGTEINVNTASAGVIGSLSERLSTDSVEALVADRAQRGGFETVDAFLQDGALAGLAVPRQGLGVQSVYFLVSIRARYFERFAHLTSVIERNPADGSLRVLHRDLGARIRPVVAEDGDATEG